LSILSHQYWPLTHPFVSITFLRTFMLVWESFSLIA
jgi:hypothetical protein